MKYILLIDEQQKKFVENKFPFLSIDVKLITLDKLEKLQSEISLILHFDDFAPATFRDYFLRYGMDMFHVTNANVVNQSYDFFMDNLPKLYEVHEMLEDEESKKVFRAFIKGHVTKRLKDFRFAPEPQYFLEGFLPEKDDIAIDGGAFDGATSRDFAMQDAKVYAFEMSSENYKNCLSLAEKYNFTVENIGLSDREETASYSNGVGAGCRKLSDNSGGVVGKFIDLDTYVIRKNLPRVDYIKLDIEGSELDMLHGAYKTISRWKPKMAVSAYHGLVDLWSLAEYIKSIRPDYEFKFRHYQIDCTDYFLKDEQRKILKTFGANYFMPTWCEAVLYCR